MRDSRNNLLQARGHLDKIGAVAMDAEPGRERLAVEAYNRVNDIYDEEYGKAMRKTEEAEP